MIQKTLPRRPLAACGSTRGRRPPGRPANAQVSGLVRGAFRLAGMHFARRTTLSAAVVAALAGTALPAAAQRSSPGPARASVATDGRQADGASAEPALIGPNKAVVGVGG